MDFAETEEQALLRSASRRFLEERCPAGGARAAEAAFDPALWREAAALGWLGCGVPERFGGAGGGLAEIAVLAEELGRAMAPLPVLPTLLGLALPVAETADDVLRARLLPAIARGEAVAALAEDAADLGCRREGAAVVLSGRLRLVADADVADWIACPIGPDLGLVARGSPGLSLRRRRVVGRERVFDVDLEEVRVPAGRVLSGASRPTLDRAALAGCAVMVGACGRALELAVEHATLRVQFGQPIGAFQAIQHLCADMAVDLANARHLTRWAVWRLARGDAGAVAHARLATVEACERILRGAHKVHGAVGLTEEHALSLHSRGLLAERQAFGGPDAWAERLAADIGL